MNNTLKMLYDEHDIISRAIALAQDARTLISTDEQAYDAAMRELIRFFRGYADKYHHYKEEEILFPEMMKKSELMADGVITEMLENHAAFREMLAEIEDALNNADYNTAANITEKYTDDLLDHIAVENDEVFQAAYSILNEIELENIYYRFADLDRELGEAKKNDFVEFTRLLSKELNH
jgi:hemerythrin-like domain-containing protein